MFGVIGSLLTDWTKRSLGSSVVDTVRHAFQCARGWISDQQWFRRRVDGGKGSRSPDKGRADTTYPAGGEPASSMRRGNEYHTLDIWTVINKRDSSTILRVPPDSGVWPGAVEK